MAEIQPPTYEQNACYTARDDRLLTASLVEREGVVTGLAVTQTTGLNVSVSAGSAFIMGDNVSSQGMYHVVNDAAVVLSLAASDPTDGRIDLIIARVYDSEYVGTIDEWQLEVVTGTPSPAPAPPALPPNSIELARITVPAGSTSAVTISTANRQTARLRASSDVARYEAAGATNLVVPVGTPGATVAVSFPAGRFTVPPIVSVTRASGGLAKFIPYTTNITTAGFIIGLFSGDGTNSTTASPVLMHWHAIQMTETTAAG